LKSGFKSELFFSYNDIFCELLAISWNFLRFLGIPWPDAAIHAEVAATHISCDHWLEAAAGCTGDIAQLRYRAIRLPGLHFLPERHQTGSKILKKFQRNRCTQAIRPRTT